MKYYSGDGLLNSTINSLPFELHLPKYNFCGPGTKLEKRLERGDRGINELDEACREHDISYHREKELKARHEADKILAKRAMERFRSHNASMGEKIAALGVAGMMKAKVKMGMGLNKYAKTNDNIKEVAKKLEKIKKLQKSYADYIDESIDILMTENPKANSKPQRNPSKKHTINMRKKSNEHFLEVNEETCEDNPSVVDTFNMKRKILSNDATLKKKRKLDLNKPLTLSHSNKRKLDKDSHESENDFVDKKLKTI